MPTAKTTIENAKITIRNRRVEVKLTCEFANHIMDNYINYHSSHDLDFLQIQKLMRHCKWECVSGRTYKGTGNAEGIRYFVFVILTPKFAVLKTCFKSND